MKICALLSGGMDSTVMVAKLVAENHEVRTLGINYGQRHSKELGIAEAQAAMLGVPFTVVDFSNLGQLLPGNSLTSNIDVPEGHYAEDNMKATVVPNRNMILLAVAIGHAIAHECTAVAYAAHGGDHAVYPDCRPEFADAMAGVAAVCDYQKIEMLRPFMETDKAGIAKLGDSLGVNFARTWSCYKGGDHHCGRCGTCVERREAFYLAGVADPTIYGIDSPTVEDMVRNNWQLND